ncbi:MAG: DUF4276 family protein [Planctomycetaceae bacterium]|jgi:hypothetical protein|nr:DUF4276 family protein [Planctomycetaceae bacterium]
MKRLVLMVEGSGDVDSATNITARMLNHLSQQSAPHLYVNQVMKVGDVNALLSPKQGKDNIKLIRLLRSVENQSADLGGVLVLIDGDADFVLTTNGRQQFCPVTIGRYMVDLAVQNTCAGKRYSFAVVFANREFESWILAGHPDFMTRTVDDDLEKYPRNAKKKIEEITKQPYREVLDQIKYTREIDIEYILKRQPRMRSFHRFDHALRQINESVLSNRLICSPSTCLQTDVETN